MEVFYDDAMNCYEFGFQSAKQAYASCLNYPACTEPTGSDEQYCKNRLTNQTHPANVREKWDRTIPRVWPEDQQSFS